MRYAPLIDAFGKQATYGAPVWFGRVGNRFGGITLLGKGEGGGVLKAYYATGREIPEFDSTGARNWKYHTSDDAAQTGPPELIPGLPNYRPKGQSWVEWLAPGELTEGADEPEQILWIIWGPKVHDYTFNGSQLVQGAKINSANNALVALFIATQRMGLPLTRLHRWGQSWIDFKDRCAAQIAFSAGSGLTAQYYAGANFETLKHTRTEGYLDRDWDYVSPAPDVPAAPFSARYTGKVRPTHTGTWTFYARYDDGCRVWVNDVQLVNDWAAGAMRESSGTVALTADVEYDITVEYFQQEALGGLHLSWSHASVPKQIVPQSRLVPPSRQVERYNAHVAFPSGTPALAAFNSVFRRAPGCTWQDVNGALRVLSTPDRPVTHRFVHDLAQTAEGPNVWDFSLKPASRDDRPDYLLISFDDLEDPFFAERTVAADRRLDPTKPPKNAIGPIHIGVATHSLASRIAETEMNVIYALSYHARLSGFADSHKVARGDVIEAAHFVSGVPASQATKLFVTEERFLSPTKTADDRSFLARLHDANWYSDAGYVPLAARIASDIPSPYVPPPPVAAVTFIKYDRFLPDGTYSPAVQGVAEFAPFAYPQRGRVYWRRPRKVFTADAATDTLGAASHGYPAGAKIALENEGGALPAPLAAATAYYVVNPTANAFQVALTEGGAPVNLTGAGTGTHYAREHDFAATNIVLAPDAGTLRGAFEVENVPLGVNEFKVVTESLKGVTRGQAAAAAHPFNVTIDPALFGPTAPDARKVNARGPVTTVEFEPNPLMARLGRGSIVRAKVEYMYVRVSDSSEHVISTHWYEASARTMRAEFPTSKFVNTWDSTFARVRYEFLGGTLGDPDDVFLIGSVNPSEQENYSRDFLPPATLTQYGAVRATTPNATVVSTDDPRMKYSLDLVKDFGAVNDGSENAAPALDAALASLANAALFTSAAKVLRVPPGEYLISSAASQAFGSSGDITIEGVGSGAVFFIDCAAGVTAVEISGAQNVKFRNITFRGTSDTNSPRFYNSAFRALRLAGNRNVTLDDVFFYGLAASEAAGAVVQIEGGIVTLNRVHALGCNALYTNSTPFFRITGWRQVDARDLEFVDYGELNDVIYSKTGVVGFAWIVLGETEQVNHVIANFNGLFMDEGTAYGLIVSAPAGRAQVRVNNVNHNVNHTDLGYGLSFDGCRSVEVSNASLRALADDGGSRPCVALYAVAKAKLSRVAYGMRANAVTADAACGVVDLEQVVMRDLVSSAATTRIVDCDITNISVAGAVEVHGGGRRIFGGRTLPADVKTELRGGTRVSGLGTPSGIYVLNNGISPTFGGGTTSYTYRVYALDEAGRRTPAGVFTHATGWAVLSTGGGQFHQVTWPRVPGAVGYVVTRDSTTQKLTVPVLYTADGVHAYVEDGGEATDAFAAPTSNETAFLEVLGRVNAESLFLGGVQIAPEPEQSVRATHSANQSIPNATFTVLTFDGENFDTAAMHSTTVNPSRLTAPETGRYRITFTAAWAPHSTGVRQSYIRLNGGAPYIGYDVRPAAPAPFDTTTTVSIDYQLNAGDYVEAVVYQTSGGALNVFANFLTFSMARIR
jgi:hypothetical protein